MSSKKEIKEKRGWHFKRVEPTVDDVWIELCAKSFIDIHSGKIVRKNYDIQIEDGQLVTTLKISSWEGLFNRANWTENGPNPNPKKDEKIFQCADRREYFSLDCLHRVKVLYQSHAKSQIKKSCLNSYIFQVIHENRPAYFCPWIVLIIYQL